MFVLLILICAATALYGQSQLIGTVADSVSQQPVIGATITLSRIDGTIVGGAISDRTGKFQLSTREGSYILRIRAVGYDTLVRAITLSRTDTVHLGVLYLLQTSLQARDVIVEQTVPRIEVKGDTLEYNASQFKTERNADADKLISKLPGVEIDGGQVRAQGQQVQRVLVDGKSFFGQDPLATLRALPADIIERVQVFDQMSDQAQFTRFDDGVRIKTINLLTRPDRRNGQFGKLYSGYGESSRYTAGANVNYWRGDQRLSVLGMSNNINQQNFAIEDILGMIGGGGNPFMRMVGSAFRAMGQSFRGYRSGSEGPGFISNFLVTPSDGITTSHAAAVNYSNEFGKWLDVSASYFLNSSTNDAQQRIDRQLFLIESPTQLNQQSMDVTTQSLNHRFNLRADIIFDSLNSLLLTPRLTWQSTDRNSTSSIITTQQNALLNRLATQTITPSNGYNLNTELLYRRRFETEGRTFSTRLQWNQRTTITTPTTTSLNEFYANGSSLLDTLLTEQPQDGFDRTISLNALYTEPIAENHQLQVGYTITSADTRYDRQWHIPNNFSLESRDWHTATESLQHRPGIRYRLILGLPDTSSSTQFMEGIMRMGMPRHMRRMMNQSSVGLWNIELGGDYQHTHFIAEQLVLSGNHVTAYTTERTFINLLPALSVSTRPSTTSFFRFWYSTRTNLPTVAQLQEALDNTNPLQFSIGNGQLDQEYIHTASATYGTFDLATVSSVFFSLTATLTDGRITNATTIATQDTTVILPLTNRTTLPIGLRAGTQMNRPVNTDGNWNTTAFALYSRPVNLFELKLNVSTMLALSYTHDPNFVNDARNITHNFTVTPGISLTSNISERVDFTLSGRSAISSARNTIRTQLDLNFVTHTLFARMTYITSDSSAWFDGWLLSAEFNYIATTGLAPGYNIAVPLLNIGIGKQIFDGRGELRLSVFDVLRENNSIVRTVGSGFIEDIQTSVLQRYALLSFTYFLRAF